MNLKAVKVSLNNILRTEAKSDRNEEHLFEGLVPFEVNYRQR